MHPCYVIDSEIRKLIDKSCGASMVLTGVESILCCNVLSALFPNYKSKISIIRGPFYMKISTFFILFSALDV